MTSNSLRNNIGCYKKADSYLLDHNVPALLPRLLCLGNMAHLLHIRAHTPDSTEPHREIAEKHATSCRTSNCYP